MNPQELFSMARRASCNDDERLLLLMAEAHAQAFLNEGDFLEAGVFCGGSAALLASVLLRRGSKRTLHLLDSWMDFPASHPEYDGKPLHIAKPASEQDVMGFLTHLGVNQCCRTYKGWFKDTLPQIPGPFALAHVDGDLYQSIKDCLEYLLPRMTTHGVIVVDDYGNQQRRNFPGVKTAVEECIHGSAWAVSPLGGERDQSVKLIRTLK